jgi:hypothetical protein
MKNIFSGSDVTTSWCYLQTLLRQRLLLSLFCGNSCSGVMAAMLLHALRAKSMYGGQLDRCIRRTIRAMHVKSCVALNYIRQQRKTLRFSWDNITLRVGFPDITSTDVSSKEWCFTCLPAFFILFSFSFFFPLLQFPLLISFYSGVLIFILFNLTELLIPITSHRLSLFLSLFYFRLLPIFFPVFLFLYIVHNCAFSTRTAQCRWNVY